MFETLMGNPYYNEVVKFLKARKLSEKSYLVGGSVRDVLIGQELKDLDFAIASDAVKLAKDFSKEIGGSFVLLDNVFSIGRIVKNHITIDFSELRGDSIEADLRERDFTINAMASDLSLERIIDPFKGLTDIKNKIIRMVNEENLKADPLRILRAYRFHATLGFDIDEETRKALVRNAHLIKVTAKERIKDEIWKIFSVPDSFKTIELMVEDEIFKAIFKTSELIPLKPDIKALKIAEEFLKNSKKESKNLSCFKFVCLFDFHSSELIKQIKPSKKEQRFVEDLTQAGAKIKKIETLLDKVRFIRDFENILYPALIYGMSKNPLGTARKWFYDEIEEFYKKVYLKNKKKLPLLTGETLISLGFEPSPVIGEILDRIETLVLAGKISTKKQAMKKLKSAIF
jgi:tRNA nucleotidyltransferase/poly(A) polymerase